MHTGHQYGGRDFSQAVVYPQRSIAMHLNFNATFTAETCNYTFWSLLAPKIPWQYRWGNRRV